MTVYSYSRFYQPEDGMVFLLCCHKPEKRQNQGKCFHYCTSRILCWRVREGSFLMLHPTDTSDALWAREWEARHHPCPSCFPAASCASPEACCLSRLLPRLQDRVWGTSHSINCCRCTLGACGRVCYSSVKRPIFSFGKANKIQTATNQK